jgi:hypothetical protein
MLRTVLALVAAGLVAALGALILGEYEFTGTLPWVAGPLFGLVLGEVAAGIDKARPPALAVGTGLLAFGGIAWAGWIDSSDGLEPVRGVVWVSAGLAALVAVLRTWRWRKPVASAPVDG